MIAPKRHKDFELPTKGFHEATIVSVEESDVISPYDDPEDPKPKILIRFRLEDEKRADGHSHEFCELYTNSVFEKSKLFQHLSGAGIDPDGIEDLEDLEGAVVRVNVGHRESKKGGMFAKALALAPSRREKSFEPTREDVPF